MSELKSGASAANEEKIRKGNLKIFVSLIVAVAMIISFTLGYFTFYLTQNKTVKTVSDALKLIERNAVNYKDGRELTADEIAALVTNQVLYYDDYSGYYTAEQYQKILKESTGAMSGFGLTFASQKNRVYNVIGNSPAEKSGMKGGDVIVRGKLSSNSEFTEFIENNAVYNFLGTVEIGEEITLVVERGGEEKTFTLTKEAYVASYVYYYDNAVCYRFETKDGVFGAVSDESAKNASLAEDTAYIVLSAFDGGAAEQFAECMDFMKTRGKTKLILDLRDNGGGFMEILTEVVSYLVDNNKKNFVLTYVEEKNGRSEFTANSKNFNPEIEKIVVLANGQSASASECLIGAMLSYSKGNGVFGYENLVLTYNESRGNYSTYGKGIMQTTYPLFAGGALKLTTAKLIWPDEIGTCIQDVGIVQNISENCVSDEQALSRAIAILEK